MIENMVGMIGNTPLIQLKVNASPVHPGKCFAKLELMNPFGMKDRVAKRVIECAKKSGVLKEGAPIIESSSGTMACGLALVGRCMGHPVHIVTDPRIDRVTHAKLESLGCKIHIVSKMGVEGGWQSARLEMLNSLLLQYPDAFWPRQYENPENPNAYEDMAMEIVNDIGKVDILVGSVGSGGSLSGAAQTLKKYNPNLKVVAVDAVGSVIFGQPDQPGRLQGGLGNSLIAPNVHFNIIDEVHWLNDEEAFNATLQLAYQEQIFAGNSSGSAYHVAKWLAAQAEESCNIVAIFPDRGDRYANSIYNQEYYEKNNLFIGRTQTEPKYIELNTVADSWSYTSLRKNKQLSKCLVFIESNTTGTGMQALQKARNLNYEPILMARNPDIYRNLNHDHCVVITAETNDKASLYQALMKENIQSIAGIMTTSDFYLETAAEIAGYFELKGNSRDSIHICRNKALFREELNRCNVKQPKYDIITSESELNSLRSRIEYPCVCKVADDSGSNNVLLCSSWEELEKHALKILKIEFNGRGQRTVQTVLVEEYIEGPEFSVEMFSWDGVAECIGITEKAVTGNPYFVEHAHIFPAKISKEMEHRIIDMVTSTLQAVKFTYGASHTEIKLTDRGAYIIETNARLPGGMIPELVRNSTGIDLLNSQILCSVGIKPEFKNENLGVSGIYFLTVKESGILRSINNLKPIQEMAEVKSISVYINEGDAVQVPENFSHRIGHVIVAGNSYEEVNQLLKQIEQLITYSVDPLPVGQRTLISNG